MCSPDTLPKGHLLRRQVAAAAAPTAPAPSPAPGPSRSWGRAARGAAAPGAVAGREAPPEIFQQRPRGIFGDGFFHVFPLKFSVETMVEPMVDGWWWFRIEETRPPKELKIVCDLYYYMIE